MDDKIEKLSDSEMNQLKALESYQMIHAAREELFENITWLAAKICDAPISIINLKGHDYQCHKFYQNKEFKIDLKESDFCAHAVVTDEIFEVPDATKDPRFRDKPIVKSEPKILFYAGIPLINYEGVKQGTICVIDIKPNKLQPHQQLMLKKLADMVVTLFETKNTIIMDMQQIKSVDQSLTESNHKLQVSLLNQQKYNNNMSLLEEMSGILQACEAYTEAYQVIAQYCQKIFPKVKGYLYFMNDTHQFVECVSYFGFKDIDDRDKAFLVGDCWGLRLGAPYQYCLKNELNNTLLCKHVEQRNLSLSSTPIKSYSCLPLSSQGDIFGLLYLEFPQCEKMDQDDASYIFRKTFAEQISLSLSNLKLRTTLQKQSITDPLTGLFNRRYYKENINWIIHKSSLNKQYLAFVMIDIDFFKKFNDTYGHDAGDVVLIKITELIREFAKDDDIVCRMGGEEFLFLIHDANPDNIKRRLESLRKATENEVIIYKDQKLQPPTISVGVAFLNHEEIADPEKVLIEADKALYKSKEAGRNRITYS